MAGGATPSAVAIAAAYSSMVTPAASPDATLKASAGAAGVRSTTAAITAATSSAHATRKRWPGLAVLDDYKEWIMLNHTPVDL